MCIGVRGKLFLVSLGLLVVSVATAEIYLLPSVEHDLTERIRQDLHVRLNLVAERSAAHAQSQRGEIDWDVLADGLGAIAQARVTLIGADGLVVGDSEVSGQALAALENHRERPEVVAAFAGRTADDIRFSATTRKRMLYAATPVPGRSGMVARLSLPLAAVEFPTEGSYPSRKRPTSRRLRPESGHGSTLGRGYLDWVLSKEGQDLVTKVGYFPIK